jgi:hypothetical protein
MPDEQAVYTTAMIPELTEPLCWTNVLFSHLMFFRSVLLTWRSDIQPLSMLTLS